MEAALKEAQLALTRAANDMAHFYNAHHREPHYTQSETKFGSMDRIS